MIWANSFFQKVVEKNKENTPGFTNKDKGDISLVEIGPRFCLTVIRIFDGSFGGPTVFENQEFVSPNFVSILLDVVMKEMTYMVV